MSATSICGRLRKRTGFRRPSNLVSSRKQAKSSASRLTRPAADPLAALMQLVKLHEYFCRPPSELRQECIFRNSFGMALMHVKSNPPPIVVTLAWAFTTLVDS